MKYDFDKIVPRRGTCSYKWDSNPRKDILPMWVADMDFRTAPAIISAIKARVEHGIFGYTKVPDEYYSAVCRWFSERHNFKINREHIIYTTGVVPAVSAIIKAMTSPGDGVVIQTPAYNCFFSSIKNNGCKVVENPLVRRKGRFEIDFEDLEQKVSAAGTKLLLLCNPHNPTGRVWTREELQRVGDICLRHGVFVVDDGIHCEFVFSGNKYTPFATLSDAFAANSATCVSSSKAFNIAGLQIANIVCPNPDIRKKIDRAININEICDVNPFGVVALIAAYEQGADWLDALVSYLYENYVTITKFFSENLPDFPVTHMEGTYLAWVDCSSLGIKSEEIERRLIEETGLWINAGTHYGNAGEGFIRINFACPRSVLEDGLSRFRHWVSSQKS